MSGQPKLSPEEIREEIDYQSKHGDDPFHYKSRQIFGDEHFSEEQLNAPISKFNERMECTPADVARFERYWDDQVWCWKNIAQINGAELSDEIIAKKKASDFAIWKNLRGLK